MENTNAGMKKRKRKRNLIVLTAIVAALVADYWIYQYQKGLSESEDGIYKEDQKTFDEFAGSEPEFGEMNILLVGSDSRGEEAARADTLMIAYYNQRTHEIKVASIMRDTYVDIPGHGMQKVNAAYAFGGPELVRQTIAGNFEVDVHYYAVIDFKGFSALTDIIAPDGIEVEIPYEMSHGIGTTLYPGKQVLQGDDVLAYVRFRHDRLRDFGRVERQQEVLAKLKEEAVSLHALANLPKLLGAADPYIDTNIDTRTLFSIGKGVIAGKSNALESLRIPLQGSYENETASAGDVLKIDFDQNREGLQDFLSSKPS